MFSYFSAKKVDVEPISDVPPPKTLAPVVVPTGLNLFKPESSMELVITDLDAKNSVTDAIAKKRLYQPAYKEGNTPPLGLQRSDSNAERMAKMFGKASPLPSTSPAGAVDDLAVAAAEVRAEAERAAAIATPTSSEVMPVVPASVKKGWFGGSSTPTPVVEAAPPAAVKAEDQPPVKKGWFGGLAKAEATSIPAAEVQPKPVVVAPRKVEEASPVKKGWFGSVSAPVEPSTVTEKAIVVVTAPAVKEVVQDAPAPVKRGWFGAAAAPATTETKSATESTKTASTTTTASKTTESKTATAPVTTEAEVLAKFGSILVEKTDETNSTVSIQKLDTSQVPKIIEPLSTFATITAISPQLTAPEGLLLRPPALNLAPSDPQSLSISGNQASSDPTMNDLNQALEALSNKQSVAEVIAQKRTKVPNDMSELEALLEEMSSPKPQKDGEVAQQMFLPSAVVTTNINASGPSLAIPLPNVTKPLVLATSSVGKVGVKPEVSEPPPPPPPSTKGGFFGLFSSKAAATPASTSDPPSAASGEPGASSVTPIITAGPYTRRGPPTPRLRTSGLSIDSGYSPSPQPKTARSSITSLASGYGSDRYSSPIERPTGPGIVTESKIMMVQRQSEQIFAERQRMETERLRMLEEERLYAEEEQKFADEGEQMRLFLEGVRREQEDRDMELELVRRENQSVMEREKARLQEEIAKLEVEKVKVEIARVEAERLETVRVAEEKRKIEADIAERQRKEMEKEAVEKARRLELERQAAEKERSDKERRMEVEKQEAARRAEQKRIDDENREAQRLADEEARIEKERLDAQIAAYERQALQSPVMVRGLQTKGDEVEALTLGPRVGYSETESEYEDDLGSDYGDELDAYIGGDGDSRIGDVDDSLEKSEFVKRRDEEEQAAVSQARMDVEAQELEARRIEEEQQTQREEAERLERIRKRKEKEESLEREAAAEADRLRLEEESRLEQERMEQDALRRREEEERLERIRKRKEKEERLEKEQQQQEAEEAMKAQTVLRRERAEARRLEEEEAREEEAREEQERLERIAKRRAKEAKLRQQEQEVAEMQRAEEARAQATGARQQSPPQEEDEGEDEEPMTKEAKIAKAERDIQKAFANMAQQKMGAPPPPTKPQEQEQEQDTDDEEPLTKEAKIAKAERDIQKAFANMAQQKNGGGTLALLQKSNTTAARPASPRTPVGDRQALPRANTTAGPRSGVGLGQAGPVRNATVAGRPSIKGGLPQGPRGGLPGGLPSGPRARRVPT